jgi:hypothetical protein
MEYKRLLYRFNLAPSILEKANSDPNFAEFIYRWQFLSEWQRWQIFWVVVWHTLPPGPFDAIKHLAKALVASIDTLKQK